MGTLQLNSYLSQHDVLTVSLDDAESSALASNDVLIDRQPAPINRSDMSFLFAQTLFRSRFIL